MLKSYRIRLNEIDLVNVINHDSKTNYSFIKEENKSDTEITVPRDNSTSRDE